MDTLRCSFCDHENPLDAKFCNACGASLQLQLCKHCGAIDSTSSRSCYKCGTPFGFVWADGDPARPDSGEAPAASGASPAGAGDAGRGTAARDRVAADFAAPHRTARQEGSAGVFARLGGLRPDAMRTLSVVLFVVAAIFAFQLFTADEAPLTIKRNIVDATLGAVPPRDAAAVGVTPVAARPDEPPPESPPEPAAPAPPPESDAMAEPENAAAPTAPADDAPARSCSAEVEALGLCD